MAKKKKQKRKKKGSKGSGKLTLAHDSENIGHSVRPQHFDQRIMEKIHRQMAKLFDEHGVETFLPGGKLAELSLMNQMLKELEAEDSEPETPLEEAEELMYQAFETQEPGERITLAEKALEISSDCVDAYVLLADEKCQEPKDAIQLYRQGVEAGERMLDPDTFEECSGHFWEVVETRPYMRAKFGLARALKAQEEVKEAIAHLEDLLRLNQSDNQGARFYLLHMYIEIQRYKDAKALWKRFEEDVTADWKYGRALLSFATKGPSNEAKRQLETAVKCNRFVPKYMLGEKSVPYDLPVHYGIGDENEAIIYMVVGGLAWLTTPGAIDWFQEVVRKKEPVAQLGKRVTDIKLDKFTYDELLALNERVVLRLDELNRLDTQKTMLEFRAGERVSFLAKSGRKITGIVTKFNKKTISVVSDDQRKWNVSPQFLEKVEKKAPEADHANSKVVDIHRAKNLH